MESMTWQSHPARERPITAVLVTIFVILIMALAYFIMDRSLLMMVIAAFIFTISLSTFYFPTTFTIDENKVVIKYMFSVKDRNLSAFRQYYPGNRGVLLSPFLSVSRLENFRGFYLRYSKNNKAEVDTFVKKLIDAQREKAGFGPSEVNSDAV
jgi:uncharacterized membrane protein